MAYLRADDARFAVCFPCLDWHYFRSLGGACAYARKHAREYLAQGHSLGAVYSVYIMKDVHAGDHSLVCSYFADVSSRTVQVLHNAK